MSNPTDTPHAWALAGYTTQRLRDVANELRENISGIVLEGGQRRTDNDNMFVRAMESLAVAADHIDRLQHDRGPHIVHTSTAIDDDELYLFGIDPMGGCWQYDFQAGGWCHMENRALMPVGPDDLPPDEKVN